MMVKQNEKEKKIEDKIKFEVERCGLKICAIPEITVNHYCQIWIYKITAYSPLRPSDVKLLMQCEKDNDMPIFSDAIYVYVREKP